jgi:hypothetical protein
VNRIFKSIGVPLAIALVTTPALAAEPVSSASPNIEDLKAEINQLTADVETLKKSDSPFSVGGYYRLQGTSESLDETNDNSSAFVDQRLRAKITGNLNDNVSLVWYGEVDSPWGEKGSCQGDNCGKLSADGVGVETKNAYVDFRVPNSDWKVRAGIQGYGFGKYESFVTNDDMNGISFAGNVGMATLTGGWFKWEEGDEEGGKDRDDNRDSANDVDFYMLNAELHLSEVFHYGLTGAQIRNKSQVALNGTAARTEDNYFGVYADYTAQHLAYSGSVLYKKASGVDSSATDGDTYMLNLYAKKHWDGGNLTVHGIYIPADDSSNGADRFARNNTGYELSSDNLQIFGTDVYYNNGSQGAKSVQNAAYQGYGLMGLMVSGDQELSNDYYLKYGTGYFRAADDAPNSAVQANGSSLGTEVAAQVGKKFAGLYDVSLRGSYGFMGDFYGNDPEDTYKVVAMVNISY